MPSAQLRQALGVSRPTLSREVARAGDRVLRFGAARATLYTTPRQIGSESSWPLYRITESCTVETLGTMHAVGRSEFALRARRPLPAFAPSSEFRAGVFPDLPWFLDDLRPQGFLGRHLANRLAATLGLPRDLRLWTGNHVITALLHAGHDLIGDLVLGEGSLAQALAGIDEPVDVLSFDQRERAYPERALAALNGEPVGSSANGEQQKFTATLQTADGLAALIVKFTDSGGNPVAARWASLLRCEALAAQTLNRRGVAAAADRVLEAGGQLFLESPRFDRTPRLGRRGQVSLAALNAALFGHAAISWSQFANELQGAGWIDTDAAEELRRIDCFGAMIGNTDMHLGNASLVLRDELPLRLAPVYDMLPMLWRPSAQGALVERTLAPPAPPPEQFDAWHWAADAALQFWAEVNADRSVDDGLRRAAETAAVAIGRAQQRFS